MKEADETLNRATKISSDGRVSFFCIFFPFCRPERMGKWRVYLRMLSESCMRDLAVIASSTHTHTHRHIRPKVKVSAL